MKIQHQILLSNKGKLIFKINIILIIFFAIAYYVQDYIISYYPLFSEKFLLLPEKKQERNKERNQERNQEEKKLFTLKSPVYYFWFSLITQSTLGYNGIISVNNKMESFESIRSIPFKIINITQIISIFTIPLFVL